MSVHSVHPAGRRRRAAAAFTMIELLVVVAIIAILIAGVFRLASAVGENTKRAETVSRIEKLQNALAGYYAEYGVYPPVERIRSGDYTETDDANGIGDPQSGGSLDSGNANRAARAQPVGFLFPNRQSLDEYVDVLYEGKYVSANVALGGQEWKGKGRKWEGKESVHIFQFGLMSYLLPRVEIVGGETLSSGNFGDPTPKESLMKSEQWQANNVGSFAAVRKRENHACARWLPNFEGIVDGCGSVLGVGLAAPYTRVPSFAAAFKTGGSAEYVLQSITIKDGWGHELYYYSPPPYQTYRVWSSGPNGQTFPPWVDLKFVKPGDRRIVGGWTADDIARFDR